MDGSNNNYFGFIKFNLLDVSDSWKYFQSQRNVDLDIYIFIMSAVVLVGFLVIVAIIQELFQRYKLRRRKKRNLDKK